LSISLPVLTNMTHRMKNNETVKAVTEEEKACYQLMNDLDHVSSHVEGSGTTRKFMQNECWSLMAYLGAPTWYITFPPADIKHPIALYLAAHKEKIRPVLNIEDAHYKLIADNPMASARFFNILVQAFLKHVIRLNEKEAGLYGRSSGYYGTVEQ
ncbi:hypothetical protein K439DRAFT_1248299, partial [Ramaria rubella]